MAKKCKDCDPNKYIEGLAWRGKNGVSYDGYKIYNDVGKPTDDLTLADVTDLADVYNPIFNVNNSGLPASYANDVQIRGIDRAQGIWFVWSFVDGLVMYGTPNEAVTPASITSSVITTTQIGKSFAFNVTLDKIVSYLKYTDFGDIASAGSADPLQFASPTSISVPLTKNKINYVGYYTGIIEAVLNGNRLIKVNKKDVLESFKSRKSLTIISTDSEGNLPIRVTSFPTIHAFKGTIFGTPGNPSAYTLTTNLPANKFTATLNQSSLIILEKLGLTWNPITKTISGVVSNNITDEPQIANLQFTVSGPNADAGNRAVFNLSILYGKQNTTLALPTISAKSFNGTVGKGFNEGLAGLNNKETIIGISSLPEGLSFNTTKKTISGTPKHAGTFVAFASCSNARGTNFLVNLTFNFQPLSENNKPGGASKLDIIKLPNWKDISKIVNNDITLVLEAINDEIIDFKKINVSEFATIRKNGQPDGTTFQGNAIPPTTFSPIKGKDAETCFWIRVNDPTRATARTKNAELDIALRGNYSIAKTAVSNVDPLGNSCYPPGTSADGPVSTAYIENLSVNVTNAIKAGLSANPSENVPTVTTSPTNINVQIVFENDFGPIGYVAGSGLDKTSAFATQKLPNGLLKYPNGIPNRNNYTFQFFVRMADTCAFNNVKTYGDYEYIERFLLWIGTYKPQAGDVYSCAFTYKYVGVSYYYVKATFTRTVWADYTLSNGNVPEECQKVPWYRTNWPYEPGKGGLVSQAGNNQSMANYGYRFANSYKDTKDIGISSLTNISILDILGEGPIEGIVDYEIVPNPGATIGDIGYKNGVKIVKYPGTDSLVRSVYWNETPIADNTYPNKGSLNFEFIQLKYDYANSTPRHVDINKLKDIELEESFYSRKTNNGEYIPSLALRNDSTNTIINNQIKLPRKLTSTKVVGTRLFGKRVFTDGTSKTYKKSLTVMTKDLYGLRLHIKALSLFKSIVDLTIWDSADQAATNSVSGRTDRQAMIFKLFLKRIEYFPNKGKVVTNIPNPNYTGEAKPTFSITAETYYNTIYSVQNNVLSLYWPPDDPGGPGNGPDGTQRQPANYTEFINGRTTYSHRHDGKVYTSYAKDVSLLQKNFNVAWQDYINGRNSAIIGESYDYSTLYIVGKLNQGAYIETFEWTGLNKYTTSFTVGWEIEIEPIYEESVDANIVIKSSIDSITEIYDDFLAIPHTAGVLTTFDSRYFTSIPQRAYDTRLLKVKIPTNYNPYSKTYDGIWDGNFNLAWTDNPAWCFYDLITNRRYGLGKYVDPNLTDKWTLYDIAKYCDELVSSGGTGDGLEPRFTCNLLISSREDAYKVVNDMASIFRAIVFYNAGLIFTSQDKPKDPLYIFNNSNVKDGEFTYSNTSKRVRRNVALVRYNDKDNFYKPAVKYVESREGLIRFGIKEIEVSAFGCTSQGQAERLGKWTLLSENLESELVNFETSLPAMYLKPGDIVFIQDQNRQNKILGGRTYELNKNYAILDIKYQDMSGYLPAINGCNFNVLTPAGNIEIGTESGNALADLVSENNNSPFSIVGDNLQKTLNSGMSTSLIRRKQIQTIKYESDYTINNTTATNVFGNYISQEESGNFAGYTRINFAAQALDETEHTLIQNTVWTIEINPENYDYNKSPSVSGFSDASKYPGASLEPYMDKTQKFRILDIEEQEEFRYKITALQYDESKYDLGDDI